MDLETRLAAFPRTVLAATPTPLHSVPRLSRALGGPEIWFKRDDLTGFALGGNKVRTLEYVIGDALDRGADTIVTGGRTFSNHVRITLAACNQLGLRGVAVLRQSGAERANHVLDQILGGTLVYPDISSSEQLDAAMADEADSRASAGANPYVIPRGAASPIGCLGYVTASVELQRQVADLNLEPNAVLTATGSGCTMAGLLAGARALGMQHCLHGVATTRPAAESRRCIEQLADQAATLLAAPTGSWDFTVHGEYRGEGAGIPTDATHDAIELVARTEGIFLDPVYTGKAMAALIDLIRQGEFGPAQKVVFLHTGGAPSLLDR